MNRKKATPFTLSVRGYRGLRNVSWSPSGVCALVGPNGSGKSTLLNVLALLRDALASSLAHAFERHGGLATVRFFGAKADEEIEFGLQVEQFRWVLRPKDFSGIGFRSWERLFMGEEELLSRTPGADDFLVHRSNQKVSARDVLALGVAAKSSLLPPQWTEPLLRILEGYQSYGLYDIPTLCTFGSQVRSERRLDRTGINIFSVLRNWRDRKADHHRFKFVVDGMARLFPDFHADLDFEATAQLVTGKLELKNYNKFIPMSSVPGGWLSALLHLAAAASADSGGVISIDEPENALHPAFPAH